MALVFEVLPSQRSYDWTAACRVLTADSHYHFPSLCLLPQTTHRHANDQLSVTAGLPGRPRFGQARAAAASAGCFRRLQTLNIFRTTAMQHGGSGPH
ncbi:hypothetical protein SKAU_G00348900 [Synaphobranchus kaupii]|uniref:Uncharacterized protein n=1 Tax=Synaphobranchus kaupii TaxID=118154 RepID=A0A9Q1EK35_SYNKA|nr:hypothetical protein SKAU_G00348900 [Synaphobranchus kaupii]